MPSSPLHCKICQGVFLPASEQAGSAVQCPHCSRQMKVGECAPAHAAPAGVAQEYRRVTDVEEHEALRDATHRRWARKLAVLGGGALLLTGAAFAWQLFMVTDTPPPMQKVMPPAGSDSPFASEVQPLVQQFLSARSWQEMQPHCADAARVQGLMEWHCARHPVQPAAGAVQVRQVEVLDSDEGEFLRVQAATEQRAVIWLLLVREDGAWKVDWEVFANAPAGRWAAFLREPVDSVLEVPLMVARKPAAEACIRAAGADPATHDAVVLWAMERSALATAILPKDSPHWEQLKEAGYDSAVKVIARVSLADPRAEPPLVRVEAIVQRGWRRGAAPRP